MSAPNEDTCIANDGLPARLSRDWAKEKLRFLETFLPHAINITKGSVPQRVFVDLFSGPGRNRTDEGMEFDGSPLIALKAKAAGKFARAGLTRAHFVTFEDWEDAALRARVHRLCEVGDSRIPSSMIGFHRGDANEHIDGILGNIPPFSSYVFVMADITGASHWPFASVQHLRSFKHKRLDLYVLFPLEIALQRLMSWSGTDPENLGIIQDQFYGTTRWREILAGRLSSAQVPATKARLIELYRSQLGTLWRHVEIVAAPGELEGNARYRMMYCTDNDSAHRIAMGAWKSPLGGQRELGL